MAVGSPVFMSQEAKIALGLASALIGKSIADGWESSMIGNREAIMDRIYATISQPILDPKPFIDMVREVSFSPIDQDLGGDYISIQVDRKIWNELLELVNLINTPPDQPSGERWNI